MIFLIMRWCVAIALAFIAGKLLSKIKLPAILGWLIAGMIFGGIALATAPAPALSITLNPPSRINTH